MIQEITSGNHYGEWITLERISKAKAKQLYNNNEKVFVKACKMRTFNVWAGMCELGKQDDVTFDNIINSFEYYNCTNETGLYTNFYKRIK